MLFTSHAEAPTAAPNTASSASATVRTFRRIVLNIGTRASRPETSTPHGAGYAAHLMYHEQRVSQPLEIGYRERVAHPGGAVAGRRCRRQDADPLARQDIRDLAPQSCALRRM